MTDKTLCYNYSRSVDESSCQPTFRAVAMIPALVVSVLFALLLLVAIFGGGYFFVYWWMISRPVPKLNGKVTLPGLSAPVEVLRDKHAIPPHLRCQPS